MSVSPGGGGYGSARAVNGDFGALHLGGADAGEFGGRFRPTLCTRSFGDSLAIFISLEGEGLSTLTIDRDGALHYVVVTRQRSVYGYGAPGDVNSGGLLIMLPQQPEISFKNVLLEPLSGAGLNRAVTTIELNGILLLPAGMVVSAS